MTKTEARQIFLARRKQLSAGEVFLYNQQIYHQFFALLDLSFIKVLHLFLSMENRQEVDTWTILDRLRREYPGIRLVIPKMKGDGKLEHFYFEGMQQLQVNKWGVTEPQTGIPADIKKIDAVLIPLLAYDQAGNRVGYGKGYYDSFLSECRTDCERIGVSFFDPVDELTDVDPWDVPLNQCITPNGIITFKSQQAPAG